VEHLSHYFKYMTLSRQKGDPDDGGNQNFLAHVAKQKAYMHKVHPYVNNPDANSDKKSSAFAETLAIMPYYRALNDKADDYDCTMAEQKPEEKRRRKCLYTLSISTTLASLWQVGIQRVLIAGNTVQQPPEIQQAFDMFRNNTGDQDMELQYVSTFEKDREKIHTPTYALEKLRMAFNGTLEEPERRLWLGTPRPSKAATTTTNTATDPYSHWKYIYFSEPDLILHTRPAAVQALTRAVADGKLLAAHRFQLLPHAVDFSNHTSRRHEYIPNTGIFADFVDLNEDTDACCDAGNHWPGVDNYTDCQGVASWKVWWYRCGAIEAQETKNESQ